MTALLKLICLLAIGFALALAAIEGCAWWFSIEVTLISPIRIICCLTAATILLVILHALKRP